mgnify:FL=1
MVKFPHVQLSKLDISWEVIGSVPEELIHRHKVFPYKKEGKNIFLAMVDPLDFIALDEITLATGLQVIPALTTEAELNTVINRYLGFSQELVAAINQFETEENLLYKFTFDFDRLHHENDTPIIQAVNGIIEQAVVRGASDIHIEPHEEGIKVRFRIDGLLQEIFTLPCKVHPPLASRLKLMAKMDIAERRKPQDGRIQIKIGGRKVDLRVSSLPTIFGEKLVIRILDQEQKLRQISQLGFSEKQLKIFSKLLSFPYGMILVTGPTGSGKTTTLYAALNELHTVEKNIITIEDPVEYVFDQINQVQVNPKAGVDFAKGLRSILRQDPDIIMVGEIRDRETAQIAVRAATTGHLVLSTLHTNNAAGALTRLVDMGVESFLVASSVVGIVAQRLVRKVCPHCREEYEPDKNSPERLFLGPEYYRLPFTLIRGAGCVNCNFTGYKGRTAIQEVLIVESEERDFLLEKADAETIQEAAVKKGMITMRADGLEKALKGITTVQEVMRVTINL